MKSWTIEYIREFGALLTVSSLIRYWRLLRDDRGGNLDAMQAARLTLRNPFLQDIVIGPGSNDNYTFSEIFVEKVYASLVRHAGPVSTVLDLGANIGLASVYFSGVWPGVSLLCVEAAHDNAIILRQNLSTLLTLGYARVIEGAVWGCNGQVALAPLEKGHVNQRRCHTDGGASDDNMVDAFAMQRLIELSGFSQIDVVKMDIEGAEREVFCSDVSWLNRVRMLAIEFHGKSREESQFDAAVKAYGFSILEEGVHTVIAARRNG